MAPEPRHIVAGQQIALGKIALGSGLQGAIHRGIDEQLMADLSRFREGVRVLVVSDNCGGALPVSRPAIVGLLKASVLVLAACEQGKYADGEGLPGHFAAAMSRALNGFSGTYEAFHHALCNEMPSYQKPDYYRLGTPNSAFESQQPFTI